MANPLKLQLTSHVNSSTLNYNWINAISTALTNMGLLIDTAVTGQIVISGGNIPLTVPASPAAQTIYNQGYEVRQMSASGLPTIYVKVYYNLLSADTNTGTNGFRPFLLITFGTSVSAAGVLGGLTTENATAGCYGISGKNGNNENSSTPLYTWNLYLASDGANWITMQDDPEDVLPGSGSGNPQAASNAFFRLQSPTTGNYVTDGEVLFVNQLGNMALKTGAGGTLFPLSLGAGLVVLNNNLNALENNTTSSGYESAWGAKGFLPPLFLTSSSAQNPIVFGAQMTTAQEGYGIPTPVVGCFSADLAAAAEFTLNTYNNNHTYMAGQTSETISTIRYAVIYE